jgi:hypothetical protein
MKQLLLGLALMLVASAASAASNLHGGPLSMTQSVLAWTASDSPVTLEVRWDARRWEPIATLPTGSTGIYVVELEPGVTYFFRLLLPDGLHSNEAALTAHFAPGEECIAQEGVTCLAGGRYRTATAYQGGGRILIVVTDTATGRTSTYLDGRRHR